MITISNNGAAIVSTSYWRTEHASKAGLLYLSINAATLRVLVPESVERLIEDLPPIGTHCDLARDVLHGRETYVLTWHDSPTDPYSVEIDQRQCDRLLFADEDGRILPLVWYVRVGGDGVREVRREQIQIGNVVAS